MMGKERHIDLFERYRNNELNESELRDFEARLTYDSDFKTAFREYQSVEEGIKGHFRNELKSKLQELDKEMDLAPKSTPIVRVLTWTSSVAAAIVIGVFIHQHFSEPNFEQIAQNHWPHEEGLPVKMSTSSKYDEAMNAFKLEEWGKAENLLSEINSDTAAYFLGEIAYRNEEYKESIAHLSSIEKGSVYYHKAQFRLALLWLASGDTAKAKEMLNFLVDEESVFSEDAQEILRKI